MSEITKMLSETRTRGDYDVVLDDFYNSQEVGIEVDLGGQLSGKDATNVYTGLNNAKKKQTKEGSLVREWGPTIKVIKKNIGTKDTPDERVFLINTSLVEGVDAESVDETETDTSEA
jgi:hypothetical protein